MKIKNIAVALMVSVLAVGGCSSGEEADTSSAPPAKERFSATQKELAGVETGNLAYRHITAVISCTGEVEVPPRGMASVTAPLGGYIAETRMVPGMYVSQGHLLAQMTNPEYIVLQQSYLETKAELTFAEQDFQRQKMLEEQNATAEKRMQESESAFVVLKARLAGLKAQLEMIGINVGNVEKGNIQNVVMLRAPISGYVTAVNHHPGEFVEPREAIFELVDMRNLHLHLNVFEQDISRVTKGQTIRFRQTGGDQLLYEGEVALISPKRNMEIRSFDVHGHIKTGEDKLKPGMYVEAEILISADSLPAVPETALVYRDNKAFVLTETDGDFAIQSVETGVRMDGWVEIINHQTLGRKTVVTEGAGRLFAALQSMEE